MNDDPQSIQSSINGSGRIGLYLHIPFCVKKCPYCDFNSYERKGGAGSFADEEDRYVKALNSEIRTAFGNSDSGLWNNRIVSSIFFGGGTPSLLSAAAVSSILQTVFETTAVDSSAEITLESNPGTISETLGAEKLAGYRAGGINRISLGAQSFSPDKLNFLGRIHPAEATIQSVANIRTAGFTNFNIDLMFGAAGEELDGWISDLQRALELRPEHLSVYSLTIETGTEFGRLDRQGRKLTATEGTSAEMFTSAQKLLKENGFGQYEISNYALAGSECRHNQNYWKRQPYLGVGAGAHSFWQAGSEAEINRAKQVFGDKFSLDGVRWSNLPGPSHYSDRIESKGNARQRIEGLTRAQSKIELLFLALRTAAGVELSAANSGFSPPEIERLTAVKSELEPQGLAQTTGRGFRVTENGFLFINNLTERFIECLET